MIQPEFAEVVFEFSKLAAKAGASQVVLIGSVARGEAKQTSDIDVVVVLETRDMPKSDKRKTISRIALDLEKKYDKDIQVTFCTSNFKNIDSYLIEKAFSEGIILYSDAPLIRARGLKLERRALITFDLTNLAQSQKMKVRNALYGHKTIRKYKDKTYESKSIGIAEEYGCERIASGVLLAPQNKAGEIEKALKRFEAKVTKRDVWIPLFT